MEGHIKKRRLEQNLLQREVAEIIGVTKSTIWNWENEYSHPKVMHMQKIIVFLGYTPNVYQSNIRESK